MDKTQIRQEINRIDIRTVYSFTKSKGRNMYCCPVCGSGTGAKKTGALQISEDGTRITCYAAGCFGEKGEDTLGALRILWKTDEKGVIHGLGYDDEAEVQKKMENRKQDETERKKYVEKPEVDYSSFFLEAHKHLNETDYLQKRGLSAAICDKYMLGYVAAWKHPKVEAIAAVPYSPRLIIPTSKYSYLARDTRSQISEAEQSYVKSKVGKMHFFNASALKDATQPIYIVEGEIDALSIMDVGGTAIGLGSANRVDALLNYIDHTQQPTQPLIIALDNDDAGKEASSKLSTGLAYRHIAHYVYNPYGNHKDANEALVADRTAFTNAIAKGAALLSEEAEQRRQDELEAYRQTTAAHRLQDFIDGIADSVNTPCLKTGFDKLDATLDGGLYPSLVVVGALSSLGKTTLVLQISDNIAASGTDILYFSLEMSESEMIGKSISRHTLIAAKENNIDIRNAKSYRGIVDGKRYFNYSEVEKNLIKYATNCYGMYADNIRIIRTGATRISADDVRDAVEKHIRLTGRKPLVVIDYLQLLRPQSDRMTDKQAADAAVTALKNISSQNNIVVIAISSINRVSYKDEIEMEALKESGGIEYGADVVIGLQFKGVGASGFDVSAAKQKNPRSVEAKILKNRNGETGKKVEFAYYPVFNYFAEV